MTSRAQFLVLAASVIALPVFFSPAVAQSPEAFYKGRQLTMIVGNAAGGGYDVYARHVSRHIVRFLPGEPTFIVQNMPGAGGFTATNHLYNIAAKDGSVAGLLQRGVPLAPLLETRKVNMNFDARKFNWLGSVNADTGLIIVWHTAKHQTMADLFQHELVVGSSSPTLELIPLFLNNLLGAKLRIVQGYKSGNDVLQAMERGEVDARITGGWTGARMVVNRWRQENKVRFLAVLSPKPNPEFPDTPLLRTFAKDDTQRQIIDLLLAAQLWGRPFALPPGVPEDRVAAMRKAFDAMTADETFLKEAAKMDLEIDILPGRDMHRLLDEQYSLSREVIDMARKAITP
jgi:tripartite-type tricarboxylate transporter receptor subunit TctC